MDQTRKLFATLLRYHRTEQQLTGHQLDKKARLPFSHTSQIETGMRSCSAQLANRLAKALGLAGTAKQRFLLTAATTTQAPVLEAAAACLIMQGVEDFTGAVKPGGQVPTKSALPASDFLFQTANGQWWACQVLVRRVK